MISQPAEKETMATIVKSTPEAINALGVMSTIINGGLSGELDRLGGQGAVLEDPMHWDGPLAARFRAEWPTTKAHLARMVADLEALRQQLTTIQGNIQAAGGGVG